MVLLSKLFFFVWIPYYALGMIWPTSPPKTGFREVSESIEQKLKWCSNDKQRADALRGHLIDARLSKPVESAVKSVVEIAIDKAMEYGANLGNLKNVNKVMDILFRAGLTRQALSNLEMNALPRVLYVDKNLNRYDKWMLALTMYRNPILDAIRAALDKEGLKIRQFALAACSLHSLISPQLAHPDLKLYRLPEATKSIKEFCSFVDELNFDTFVTEEEMFDEQRDFMLKSYKGAAHLVCESALLYPEELFDPKQEEEVFKRSNDEFSAIIVIWNANDLDLKIANNFLNVVRS
ncbi:uncharacterized protein LOC135847025 [Planococcus citri]|uniref:uncharacterized protein LOC135847025 n=1 Tax=Planococcus citri TaxID=170843 RepID=UPI0031FA43AD